MVSEMMQGRIERRAQKLTADDIIEAMRKNGYEQAQGSYIVFHHKDNIISACAFGQAALNLAPKSWSLREKGAFANAVHYRGLSLNDDVFGEVTELNDECGWTPQQIANHLDTMLKRGKKDAL